MRCIGGLFLLLAMRAATATAQQTPTIPHAALSTRASVEVLLNGRLVSGHWNTGSVATAGPARIAIDYGQPHVRGRKIIDSLVPYDTVWRTGANLATHLTTDGDLVIGNALVIVSKQTLEWGEDHDASQDLARVALVSRTLPESMESFTIWLIPSPVPAESSEPAHGVLKMAWERTEVAVDWRVAYKE